MGRGAAAGLVRGLVLGGVGLGGLEVLGGAGLGVRVRARARVRVSIGLRVSVRGLAIATLRSLLKLSSAGRYRGDTGEIQGRYRGDIRGCKGDIAPPCAAA